METLAGWLPSRLTGGEFHPLLVAAAYLLEFLAIRPFADGNGRVGRLLTNLLLLRCGHAYLPYGSIDAAIHARSVAGSGGYSTLGTEGLLIYDGVVTMTNLSVGSQAANSFLTMLVAGGGLFLRALRELAALTPLPEAAQTPPFCPSQVQVAPVTSAGSGSRRPSF